MAPEGRNEPKLHPKTLELLIFGTERSRRFTQDSPVMPDVWMEYGKYPDAYVDLLLTPHSESSAAELGQALRERLRPRGLTMKTPSGTPGDEARITYNESYVVAELDFDELVKVALPMTHWWSKHVWRADTKASDAGKLRASEVTQALVDELERPGMPGVGGGESPDLLWVMRVVGRIQLARTKDVGDDAEPSERDLVEAAKELLVAGDVATAGQAPLLWRVDRNRPAATAIDRSMLAVKADAAVRLFDLNCRDLRWAVVDSGIDAEHPAFRKREMVDGKPTPFKQAFQAVKGKEAKNNTRVIATYDFTRLRTLLNPDADLSAYAVEGLKDVERKRFEDFRQALPLGRSIDWLALEPLLRVRHEPKGPDKYTPPEHEHGTHVAGILTADWKAEGEGNPGDHDLVGIAVGLEVYDLRVLGKSGGGDEFSVISALQFVRYLNANRDRVLVHGVNMSLSIRHDVANYACGRTPICEECERLVGAGTVVVAAAGNDGYAKYQTLEGGSSEGYRSISITDPGNAEGVITVGATHRYRPHQYGISYFSSRGPTGDGRLKPDIVAPGEKITAPIPGKQLLTLDGTSMAAPHVSAAAALLMARHQELIGQPARIKRILCESATDLGRERYFQGNGMLDVLRALQAV